MRPHGAVTHPADLDQLAEAQGLCPIYSGEQLAIGAIILAASGYPDPHTARQSLSQWCSGTVQAVQWTAYTIRQTAPGFPAGHWTITVRFTEGPQAEETHERPLSHIRCEQKCIEPSARALDAEGVSTRH